MKLDLRVVVLTTICLGWCAGTDLRSRHTPAYIILSKRNGEIWRCLLDAPTVCELFYSSISFVETTLIHGEHLYIGDRNTDIIKCYWYERHQCALFQRFTDWVFSFTVIRGRLYVQVGLRDVYRCELSLQPYLCSKVREFENPIFSEIYINDKYIYTCEGRQLLRFTEDLEVKSQHILTDNAVLISITGYGQTVIMLSGNAVRYYKTLNETSSPVSPPDNSRYLTSIVVFKNKIYLTNNSNNTHNILICNWDKLNNCAEFVQHKNVHRISFVYATHHMRSGLLDVSSCALQSSPWTLFNYREDQWPMLEASVVEGKLVDAHGELVDTRTADVGYSGPAAVFAMGLGGQILFSYAHRSSLVHITSLFDGLPVSGAGEMIVHDGVVKKIVACSVFYEPDIELNKQVVDALNKKGYEGEIELKECVYTCDRE